MFDAQSPSVHDTCHSSFASHALRAYRAQSTMTAARMPLEPAATLSEILDDLYRTDIPPPDREVLTDALAMCNEIAMHIQQLLAEPMPPQARPPATENMPDPFDGHLAAVSMLPSRMQSSQSYSRLQEPRATLAALAPRNTTLQSSVSFSDLGTEVVPGRLGRYGSRTSTPTPRLR